jgi:hypothetical protein
VKHKKQMTPSGCQYHSAYALLGDESLLEYVDDASSMRFILRLLERGKYLFPYWGGVFSSASVPETFWRHLAELCGKNGGPQQMLCDYLSPAGQGHTVAAILNDTTVWVSDSMCDDIQAFWLDDFLKSRYAKAYQVNVLYSTKMEDYEPELVSQNPNFLRNDDHPSISLLVAVN